MTLHDVFLSHSSHDKPVADAVCAALEEHNIRCWIAARDITPGQDWSDAIIDAITGCRVFLLILSDASNHSEQVKREVQNSVTETKPILPLRIEDVVLSKHMRYFIGTPHWLDALPPPIENYLPKITETVRGLLASLDDPPLLVDTAPLSLPPLTAVAVPLLPVHPFSPELLTVIEKALARMIGPLARVLVKRAAREAANQADLYLRLAAHLPTPAEKAQFLKAVPPLEKI